MTKPKRQREIQPTNKSHQKKRRGRPEKLTKIDDTPENVARALWGVKSTKFPKTPE